MALEITEKENVRKFAGTALFNLGFRPFFLGAGFYALVAMFAWWMQYSGYISSPSMTPAWHAHEMLFGYTFAIIVGFLLTSIRNWTGLDTLSGSGLFLLFALWVVARFANGAGAMLIAAISDLVFMVVFGLCAIIPIVQVKQWRQTAIVGMILVMLLANSLYYAGHLFEIDLVSGIGASALGNYIGFYVILGLVLMMTGRVVPFFIRLGVEEDVELTAKPLLEIINFVIYAIFTVISLLWLAGMPLAGAVYLLAGILTVLNSYRLLSWHTNGIWARPLLWTLFVSYGFIVLGFLLYSLLYFGWFSLFIPLHAIAVGGIGLLTLSMMARVSLGHSGRSIHEPPKSISIAFLFLIVAAIVRVLFPVAVPEYHLTWIQFSQFLWMAGFLVFLYGYAPMLVQPRIDGKPG